MPIEGPNHTSDRQRLASILGMLGSDHAGERAAAGLKAEQLRRELGMTWPELNDAPQAYDAPAANANPITGEGSAYYKTLVRSGYAPVNGLRMYYEIHGTSAARPLVTIHGFLGLRNVFPSLVRNRQLIALDLQGHDEGGPFVSQSRRAASSL